MNKTDKSVIIGAIIVSAFLLYMIKPAVAHTWCFEWEVDLDDRFVNLEQKQNHTDVDVVQWFTLQRENLIWIATCSDITMFF